MKMEDLDNLYNNLGYKKMLELIENHTFQEKYPYFNVIRGPKYYHIYKIKNPSQNNINIYKEEIEVTITFINHNNKKETIKINSTVDFQKICRQKSINLNNLYILDDSGSKTFYNKNNILSIIPFLINNKIEFLFENLNTLPEKINRITLLSEKEYTIQNYSNFYNYYFNDDNPNSKLFYFYTKNRKKIDENISILLKEEDIRQFRFTGPCSTGKSITLLRFCRSIGHAFYLNMKFINKLERLKAYSILIEEFSNVDEIYFNAIQETIKSNYERGISIFETIIHVIDYFSSKEQLSVFVFDQYKYKNFPNNIDYIIENTDKKIKFILCSSINDEKMRDEFYKTMYNFNKLSAEVKLNKNNQKFYFYYDELYEKKFNNKNDIERKFNGIPKYIKYYENINKKNLKEIKEIDDKVRNDILKKIEEFYINREMTLEESLEKIKSTVSKRYKIDKLNNVIQYCPLKFFIVKFLDNGYFRFKMAFPFLKFITNKKLCINEVDQFFRNKKYLNPDFQNDSLKGDYFEFSAKYGLKKILKLPATINNEIKLKEIITMETDKEEDQFEDKDEDLDEDEDSEVADDENIENEEEQNENDNIMDVSIESENIQQENLELESDPDEEEEMELESINQEENKPIKELLKKFSIDIKSSIFGDNIEKYRRDSIDYFLEAKKKDIPKKEYIGTENYFIDQSKKKGRLLDYAILYGEKNKKIFIGFQMKCYFQSTKSIKPKFRNKQKIKKACQEILFKSMALFDCKIIKWYYFLIFYYNTQDKTLNLNNSIIKQCRCVEFLFYDPVNKNFYDRNYNQIEKLNLTLLSDLDNNLNSFQEEVNNIDKVFSNVTEINDVNGLKNSFMKDFEYMKLKNVNKILNNIGKIMKINNKLSLNKAFYDVKYIIPPEKNYVHLYKKKEQGFLGIKTIYKNDKIEKVESYDLISGFLIDDFYSSIDLKYKYMYSLSIKAVEKRNYMTFLNQYQLNNLNNSKGISKKLKKQKTYS